MKTILEVARKNRPADLVIKNAQVYNPFIQEWEKIDFAIQNGRIAGTGSYQGVHELDFRGLSVVPGFIDAHVHIESSLLIPTEFSRLVLSHGTTTIIADPHEIANVCGMAGIEYMLASRDNTPLDLLFTIPSCVPATPLDEAAEVLDATSLSRFIDRQGILGMGEMMNIPGVLNQDPDVMQKLTLMQIRDGHAPFLTGPDLQAYLAAGIQSDHETISPEEGWEKIKSGMYLYLREGSTEHNLTALLPVVNAATVDRCSFCTDDRHADMLIEAGHIDDCIRKAIANGLEPELAYRMATLSPAERFSLHDRGALAPGRLADFCVIDNVSTCNVIKTFKKGKEITNLVYLPPRHGEYQFRSRIPSISEIQITGEGMARVIGIMEGQIATESLTFDVFGNAIPDLDQDILKVVVASRYDDSNVGIGLVHGLRMTKGAIGCSVAHDSHHVIAVGTTDEEIIHACREIIKNRGGMVCIREGRTTLLPLTCAGLMAEEPFERVYDQMSLMKQEIMKTGSIADPFMYLSFLSLTVIPSLRVTPKGVFDSSAFAHVSLFTDEEHE
ncbi:adenine deaminase [Methanospirillum sp.]|uniref:adenine deaminase n=1 Tax=Methanospirillum sp. TaxID=45200 RepID=UPI00262FF63D|nr:adenine deaminase [Methanospirillum sp.]